MDYALTNMLFFTGKPNPHFQKTDLKRVIEEASLFAAHLLQQKEIDLVLSLDPLTTPIFCDEDLLRQIFVNLILNAIDAMKNGGGITPPAGRLTIHAVSDPQQVHILVSDTGCGIPEDQLSKIFDPFFTTKKKGTGLGLAIVYSAVVAHGGTIEVKSTIGKGTVFTVNLPWGGD
jgi:signal transduction histidine kinase